MWSSAPIAKGNGQKYYMVDRKTGNAEYFARGDNGSLEFFWHPFGNTLYYHYPGDRRHFMFDPATGKHGIMQYLPPLGSWKLSRDGRYVVQWTQLDTDERIEFQVAKKLLPKISIWDSQTGLTRRYCLPETGEVSGSQLAWSPDNRYLAFRMQLPLEGDTFPTFYTVTPEIPPPAPTPIPLETQYQLRNARTLVLDTQTGSVTVLSDQVGEVIVWTENAQ
jgi:hypothetical protein